MFKCIALLKRRPGLSKEQFIDYYENHHSVLIRSLFPEILEYRRNYVDLNGLFQFEGSSPIDFNSVTEMWFQDRATYDRFIEKNRDPETARRIMEDELNVFDRSATRMFVVDENRSNIDAQNLHTDKLMQRLPQLQ